MPGAAVGILRDGAVVAAYCGVADTRTGDPVGSDTRFAVGSVTKSMVATVLIRLAAAGHLALDDPVAAHVPELRAIPWGERATVRDLLANRSRLPQRAEFEFAGLEGADDDVLARFASRIAMEGPSTVFWSYSNAGWCLLGRAIETLTGLTWEDAMHANLLAPFELAETTFATGPVAERRASGHELAADRLVPVEPWTPRAFGPSGTTVLSTVGDMMRFAAFHLEDDSLAILRTSHADIRINAWLDAWCLGWARFDWDGGPVWGWDGLLPGQRTVLRLMPEQRAAIVLMTNGSTGRAMYRSFFADLTQSLFGISVPPLRLDASPAAGDYSRFAGVYAWPDRQVQVTATADGLLIKSEQGEVEALSVDERTFLVAATNPDNPTVTFGSFDDTGRPRVLYVMLWGLPRIDEKWRR